MFHVRLEAFGDSKMLMTARVVLLFVPRKNLIGLLAGFPSNRAKVENWIFSEGSIFRVLICEFC